MITRTRCELLHPRTIGWFGGTTLTIGGSNQSLFLIAGASGRFVTQGTVAMPRLILGLLLSGAASSECWLGDADHYRLEVILPDLHLPDIPREDVLHNSGSPNNESYSRRRHQCRRDYGAGRGPVGGGC